MGRSRRRHSQEFKLEAVKQVVEQGRSVSEVADALGVNRNMLTRWKAQFAPGGQLVGDRGGRSTEKDDEIRRLRRELDTAQQERDILKKALAYFAKNKN
jgi:transposase